MTRASFVEASASVADLGTFVPLTGALVAVNGVDAAAAFAVAGALSIAAGILYRVPVPVQPIKAAAAIAIATRAPADVIAAAGLLLGAILLMLGVSGLARHLPRLFPKPVIRGNQLGVGIMLVMASARIAGASALPLACAMLAAIAMAGRRRAPLMAALVVGGVAWVVARAGFPVDLAPAMRAPHLPSLAHLGTALTLLVIPQLPLTLANAITGVADLEREYYGARAIRVTHARLCVTSGLANLAAGALGGMPLCHGSSGLTAYRRAGARTGMAGVAAGVLLLVAGLGIGGLLALIPTVVLAALLAYTGVSHAMLISDLRGRALATAVTIGGVGVLTSNLALGMLAGFASTVLLRARPRALVPVASCG